MTNAHRLLRISRSMHLPTLRQGGILCIRGNPHVDANVRIVPEWRDDALLTLRQTLPSTATGETYDERKLENYDAWGREACMQVVLNDDVENGGGAVTSLGRKAPMATVDVGRKETMVGDGDDDDDDDGGIGIGIGLVCKEEEDDVFCGC
mmetsp:Transcript_52843/g.78360  ORF Transcript_52843/g.78360 Transcript_52843/m.78360 type:complete len:150 (+) Transcript_52843:218-667(+)